MKNIGVSRILLVLYNFYWNRAAWGKHSRSLAILTCCSTVLLFWQSFVILSLIADTITSLSFPKPFQSADGEGISASFSAVEKLNLLVICPTVKQIKNFPSDDNLSIKSFSSPAFNQIEVLCSSKATVRFFAIDTFVEYSLSISPKQHVVFLLLHLLCLKSFWIQKFSLREHPLVPSLPRDVKLGKARGSPPGYTWARRLFLEVLAEGGSSLLMHTPYPGLFLIFIYWVRQRGSLQCLNKGGVPKNSFWPFLLNLQLYGSYGKHGKGC